MTELYLNDLTEYVKRDFLNMLERKGRRDLVEAYEDGEDILIGESFDNIKDYKVV